jgi:hypothetical protein
MADMSKAEFVKLLQDPESGGPSIGGRTSWVAILSDLQGKTEPFTVKEIADEYELNNRYTYSHFRDWVADGKLMKINVAGKNYYMHADQLAEDEE